MRHSWARNLYLYEIRNSLYLLCFFNNIMKVFWVSEFIYFLFSLCVGFTVYVFYYTSAFVTIFLIR